MFDFKKEYKDLYASKKIVIKQVPKFQYLTIEGAGNPNEPEFGKNIEALYPIAYALKMSYKTDYKIPGFYEYVVAPLEGFYTTVDDKAYDGNKNKLKYKLIINTPDFITEEHFKYAQELAYKKKQNERVYNVKLETIDEGYCGQVMHIGPFDTENKSIALLEAECAKLGYEILPWTHHEIYLSDFRKVTPDKYKTIIRYQLKKV